jgi:YD repeat-containing protein
MNLLKFALVLLLCGFLFSCEKNDSIEPIDPAPDEIPKIKTETDGTYFGTHTYDALGRRIEENYADGWKTIYKYEDYKVTCDSYREDGTYYQTFTYLLNEKGLCISFHENLYGRTTTYQYDNNDRRIYRYTTDGDGSAFQEGFFFYEGDNLAKDSTSYFGDDKKIVVTYEYFTDIESTLSNANSGKLFLGKDNKNPFKRVTRTSTGNSPHVYNYAIPLLDADGHIIETSYSLNGGTGYTTQYTYY